jgi:methylmalonyl-CoA mutase cobalamin-binding domain/chain
MDESLNRLREAILGIDKEAALEATRELLDAGADPRKILDQGLTEAMLELGRRWTCGTAFLPEVVSAADIFGDCSELVEPALLESGDTRAGHRVVLATVQGDLHDLGKNIVGSMMKTVGLEVEDLGKNVSADQIVAAVRDTKPALVGLSALLTTTMPQQQKVIELLDAAGLRDSVKVIVGGAPVTDAWAEQIGADGFAPNAAEAVDLALSLVEG